MAEGENPTESSDEDDENFEITPDEICNLLETKFQACSKRGVDDFPAFLRSYSAAHPRFVRLLDQVFLLAISRESSGVVGCLLETVGQALDVNAVTPDAAGADTALTLASRAGDAHLVSQLLARGATVTARNQAGDSALDIACTSGDLPCVTSLLDHILPRAHPELLYSGMSAAAYSDMAGVLRVFVDRGVDVNLNMDDDLGTALHRCAEAGSVSSAEVLLRAGADVESLRRCFDQTPLMRAAEYGQLSVLQRLVASGASIDRMTDECSSALNLACHYGHTHCVKYLLGVGADPDQENPWGYTPLFMGADTPAIVRILVKAGVSLDRLCGERGEAAIHLAAVIGSSDTVCMLLDSGSDINLQTAHQETPLWLAAWKGHVALCRLLIQRNCTLNDPSNGCQVYAFDYMPVEIAIGLGHFDIMRMIFVAGGSVRNCLYYNADEDGLLEALPWVKLRKEPIQILKANDDEYQWMYGFLTNPGSLKHLSRLTLRRTLLLPLKDRVDRLPLPSELKAYLCFCDI